MSDDDVLLRRIEALSAEVAKAKMERDEYRDKWQSIMKEETSSRRLYLMHTEQMKSEIDRLHTERAALRFRVAASELTDQQLVEELAEMQRAFSKRGAGNGSPGEWSYERMDEVATEQQRRAPSSTAKDAAHE